ncbi:MAG: DNA helicase RecG [Candidatus Andersenbacteria bacterium CG10_big_fil_rev_8_21_14_0_10_54_11]|uniref:Probable DNA 3'-5' helicase RecG n=1 Tax=Candidatus Andersenbacteria bacterium CG10_big_fil_rev_8_21_14_0_10_54_11 TaxID=1974485 RepID=A0A2M6WZZ8_9BACT|nr:MAG: DNA helicase RecG [Candidatus Andersenbacteria bacterium CG10_big_fil_rev_8_21_14_0_10_54_11]
MKPLKLSSPITQLSGIGPAKAKFLKKLGLAHVRDLLYTFPRRYDDFSTITPIKDLVPGRVMTVHAKVKSIKQSWGYRGRQRLLRIFVELEDDTGILSVTWYNLRFLSKQLWVGRPIYVAGRVEVVGGDSPAKLAGAAGGTGFLPLTKGEPSAFGGGRGFNTTLPSKGGEGKWKFRMRSPVLEYETDDHTHTARITPVYPETYGVTSRFLRYQVKKTLPLINAVPEYLPEEIRKRRHLIGIREAVREVHFPTDTKTLTQAQARLRFDELFFLQLAAQVRRRQQQKEDAVSLKITPLRHAKKLLYRLTGAQQEALAEIATDLAKPHPMNRLLQGDVGSGKSAVALLTAAEVLRAGHAVLYLAPTEILARQQAASFAAFLGQDKTALLIAATPQREKKQLQERLVGNEPLCVIGTHALLQEGIHVPHCALAIIDEQHRFGVAQRQALQKVTHLQTITAAAGSRQGGTNYKLQTETRSPLVPHLLSMTATPIPRTLNLTVHGDLDVSVLNELPVGRKPITTIIAAPHQRPQAWDRLEQEIASGRQAYVIAPLVEQSEVLEAKSAKETLADMQKRFPQAAVDMVHGKMKPEEKEAVMRSFAAGAIHILVATSVVEVGVNVPNATCMIIEGAERFGLAQLHQMRGRVGRGEHQSYCFLLPTTTEAAQTERLHVLAKTGDGFVIAEEDLRLRGPGEVYGIKQAGFDNLQVASLLDYPTIKAAREEADRLLTEDPELKNHDILRRKVEQKNLQTHFE